MSTPNESLSRDLQEVLRSQAAELALDPESIRKPIPGAVIARRLDGTLVRFDISSYSPAELSL